MAYSAPVALITFNFQGATGAYVAPTGLITFEFNVAKTITAEATIVIPKPNITALTGGLITANAVIRPTIATVTATAYNYGSILFIQPPHPNITANALDLSSTAHINSPTVSVSVTATASGSRTTINAPVATIQAESIGAGAEVVINAPTPTITANSYNYGSRARIIQQPPLFTVDCVTGGSYAHITQPVATVNGLIADVGGNRITIISPKVTVTGESSIQFGSSAKVSGIKPTVTGQASRQTGSAAFIKKSHALVSGSSGSQFGAECIIRQRIASVNGAGYPLSKPTIVTINQSLATVTATSRTIDSVYCNINQPVAILSGYSYQSSGSSTIIAMSVPSISLSGGGAGGSMSTIKQPVHVLSATAITTGATAVIRQSVANVKMNSTGIGSHTDINQSHTVTAKALVKGSNVNIIIPIPDVTGTVKETGSIVTISHPVSSIKSTAITFGFIELNSSVPAPTLKANFTPANSILLHGDIAFDGTFNFPSSISLNLDFTAPDCALVISEVVSIHLNSSPQMMTFIGIIDDINTLSMDTVTPDVIGDFNFVDNISLSGDFPIITASFGFAENISLSALSQIPTMDASFVDPLSLAGDIILDGSFSFYDNSIILVQDFTAPSADFIISDSHVMSLAGELDLAGNILINPIQSLSLHGNISLTSLFEFSEAHTLSLHGEMPVTLFEGFDHRNDNLHLHGSMPVTKFKGVFTDYAETITDYYI